MRVVGVLLAAVLLVTAGCATDTADPRARALKAPSRSPQAGGLVHRDATFDGTAAATETAAALAAGRKSMGDLASFWYEYDDTKPGFAPPTLRAFTTEATCALVPVFEYSLATTEAASIYDVTRQEPGEYILVAFLDGELVAACDWEKADQVNGRGPWFSFYGLGYLGFPEAIPKLRAEFDGVQTQIRVLRVPRGYWVVGRAGGRERAVFVAHQGSYDDDPREPVYSLEAVLAYGAPHADGN